MRLPQPPYSASFILVALPLRYFFLVSFYFAGLLSSTSARSQEEDVFRIFLRARVWITSFFPASLRFVLRRGDTTLVGSLHATSLGEDTLRALFLLEVFFPLQRAALLSRLWDRIEFFFQSTSSVSSYILSTCFFSRDDGGTPPNKTSFLFPEDLKPLKFFWLSERIVGRKFATLSFPALSLFSPDVRRWSPSQTGCPPPEAFPPEQLRASILI